MFENFCNEIGLKKNKALADMTLEFQCLPVVAQLHTLWVGAFPDPGIRGHWLPHILNPPVPPYLPSATQVSTPVLDPLSHVLDLHDLWPAT